METVTRIRKKPFRTIFTQVLGGLKRLKLTKTVIAGEKEGLQDFDLVPSGWSRLDLSETKVILTSQSHLLRERR